MGLGRSYGANGGDCDTDTYALVNLNYRDWRVGRRLHGSVGQRGSEM